MYRESQPSKLILRALVAFTLLSVGPIVAVAADDEAKQWESVKAELQKRQKRFDCVTVEFDDIFVDGLNRPQAPTKRNTKWKLQLKGDRLVRLETKGDTEPRTNSAGKLVAYQERFSISDGQVHTSFFPKFGGEYDAGFVDMEDRIHLTSNVTLIPLAMCFRPLEWAERSNVPPLRNEDVSLSRNRLEGTECVVAKWSRRSFDITAWFDPDRNYAPLQLYVVRPSEERELRWRIEYDGAANSDIPTGWKYMSLIDGGKAAIREQLVQVRSYRADDIPESVFTLDFPVGTFVTDKVLKQNYILLKDGSERVVQDGEWHGKTYDDILNGR